MRFRNRVLAGISTSALLVSLPLAAQATNLKEALESAYMNNPEIKSARQSLYETEEEVSLAYTEWQPTITASYERGRQRTSRGTIADSYSTTDSRSVQLSQPVFDGFGTVSRISSAKLRVDSQQARLRQTEQDVLLQAISAYLTLLRDEMVFKLSKSNESVLGEQLRAVQDRFDVGEVTKTDVSQSEARRARAMAERIQADADVLTARANYERIVKMPADNLEDTFKMIEIPATLEEVIARAEAANPALLRAEYLSQSSGYDVKDVRAELFPRVAVQASALRSEGSGQFGGTDFDNDEVGLRVTVPIYQAGNVYARIRQAKHTRERREMEKETAADNVISGTVQVWKQVEATRATIKANKSAIDSAVIALDGVKQEAKYGARTTLDVLDAEQELFQARVNLVRAERNAALAVFNLVALMGELTPDNLGLEIDMAEQK